MKLRSCLTAVASFLLVSCASTHDIKPAQATHAAVEALLHTTSNADIRQGYVDTEHGQVHYWEAGNGPAILLVHQSASSSEEYAGLVEFLSNDYRLISYDWPGHGMSDDPKAELGVEGFSDGAISVFDKLGVQKAHVAGHHGGALVAMNLADKHPARFEKLILSGTSGLKTKEAGEAFSDSLNLKNRYLLDREGKSLDAAWNRFINYMPNSAPEEIIRPYITSVVRRVRPYDAHYEVLKFDRRPALKAIKNKDILLLQGANDAFVENQESLLNILPKAERVVLEETGTFMFYEDPKALSEVIMSFLSKP